MTKFKAILFDNDGILMDTEKLYFFACRDTLAEEGFEYTEEMYAHYTLYNNRGAWHYLVEEQGYSEEKARVVQLRWRDTYLRLFLTDTQLFPETIDVLKTLQGKFRLGLVTGSSQKEIDVKFEQTGIKDFFEICNARETYERSKPFPDPYLHTAEMMRVKPEECLVIEDSPRGAIAAKAAGMTCYIIPNGMTEHLKFPEVDCTLKNLSELVGILEA
jgi:HAD superfamily hydrolase (TIGR01509 family)